MNGNSFLLPSSWVFSRKNLDLCLQVVNQTSGRNCFHSWLLLFALLSLAFSGMRYDRHFYELCVAPVPTRLKVNAAKQNVKQGVSSPNIRKIQWFIFESVEKRTLLSWNLCCYCGFIHFSVRLLCVAVARQRNNINSTLESINSTHVLFFKEEILRTT